MEQAPRRSSNLAFSLGIDVGKTNLELALRSDESLVARTTVSNDPEGHEVLVRWLEDRGAEPETVCVCMEASGGFEKAIARRLYEEGYRVSVVNPRRIKGYASSQLQRTKTDAADAALIARFGEREEPRPWEPPEAAKSRLQELTRARQALQKEKTRTLWSGWTKPATRRFAARTAVSSTRSSANWRSWKKKSRIMSKRIRS
jgi:transposase